MRVAVIVPTVAGRETQLAECVRSHAGSAHAIHILKGHTTCGAGWNAGALLALSDPTVTHVLFSADDLVALPGWLRPAVETVARHELPNAILRDENGAFWNVQDGLPGALCAFPRVPFLPVELLRQLLPIPPMHYYSDCWVGSRGSDLGWPSRLVAGFEFTHTWAQPGRIQDSEPDRLLYEAL